MTEHEKLKEICDKIWYENYILEQIRWWYIYKWSEWIELDVIEIIFTQEFMDKLDTYLWEKDLWFCRHDLSSELIWKHLNNPVEYIYNLIK